ncbi:hypothetical protein DFH08DRAFT_854840 [Mycena albidolilacea]|uniref:Uncharacterized protein n=1 Tax=Mycena albidolilacea TaxID=1033008 RepID=A0AAD7EW69_9AGAR|nr:hypothetical protein DFH08DRAFT_854840 [Mycena albidolilacea]
MDDFWYAISQLWVGTFFYGIYCVLFCICIYILLKRPRNLANTVLLVTAIALFSISTTQTVINIVLGASDIDGVDVPYDTLVLAETILYVINNVIADGLVIYRCYTAKVPALIGWDPQLPFEPFFALSLAINVLVTTLTAGRIWWICRKARSYLTTDVQRRSVASVSIIVESGVIYSVSVLMYLILGAIPSAVIVQDPVVEMLAQVVGIVPTLIIVRVGLGVHVQSVEKSVKTATNTSEESRAQKHHILGMARASPYNLDKDTPPLPDDLEKGKPVHEVRKPQPF